jgi:nucleoside-diphosphate-sugar epimerase
MNILIVGGSYFVGKAIAEACVAHGHAVTVLNRGSRGVPGTAQLIADRNDAGAMKAVLRGKAFDVVVDSSCYVPEQARGLLSALDGRCVQLIWISSAAVYATHASSPTRESEPLAPPSAWGPYGDAKARSEEIVAGAAAACDIVILRPCYIYGPGDRTMREAGLWRRLERGEPIAVPGPEIVIQFIHIDDVVDGVMASMLSTRTPGVRSYNLGGPDAVSMADHLQLVARACGCRANVAPPRDASAAPFPYPTIRCVLDTTKASTELRWSARIPLADGFSATYAAEGSRRVSDVHSQARSA